MNEQELGELFQRGRELVICIGPGQDLLHGGINH